MKRRISITLLFCLLITFLFVGCGESSGNNETDWRNEEIVDFVFDPADYSAEPVWFDEFNGTELDPTKWAKCPEWPRQAHMQNSGSWNKNCSYVEDGNLVLECRKENGNLISGGIRTKTEQNKILFEQAEGLFEFKFKADWNSGMWHAVWLMCEEEQTKIGNGATDGAEIDMIEILPNDGGKMYYQSAVHWDGYAQDHRSNHKGKNITKDFFGEWHVAQFVWHKHGYQLYMDGKLAYDMPGREFGGTSKVPTYLKITSEFGSWGGPLYEDKLPAKFYVDYIKVYERTSPYPYDVEEEPETPEPDNEETEEAVNLITNGEFTTDTKGWEMNIKNGSVNVVDGKAVFTLDGPGTQYGSQTMFKNMSVKEGDTYNISFKVKSSVDRQIKWAAMTSSYAWQGGSVETLQAGIEKIISQDVIMKTTAKDIMLQITFSPDNDMPLDDLEGEHTITLDDVVFIKK